MELSKMQDFNVGDVIRIKEDSDQAVNWKYHYAIVLKSEDPLYSCSIRCINTVTNKFGEGEEAKYFINGNFRLMSKAERVLYVK